MPSFFLAMIAAVLASFGGRDRRLVAHLSGKLGATLPLLAVAWLAVVATSALAAIAGAALATIMPAAAKHMLVAFALVLGAVELLWQRRLREAEEPTRSAFAILIVLGALQLGDGARFLVLAVAVATGDPVLAALGGAVGSGAVLTAGWAMGPGLGNGLPLRAIRYTAAALMAGAGLIIGLSARGLLG